MIRRLLSLFVLACLAPPAVARADALDDMVRDVMASEQVPGAAVVVLREGQEPDLRAYGVKRLGDDEPVDIHTRFGIASLTKAFTALAAGQEVDRGGLTWDGKVIDVLPGFAVADPYVTANATLRDLLAQRTGTVRGDLLWFGHPGTTGRDLVGAMHDLPQETSFREGFSYSNLMYTIAGEMVAQSRGRPWEDVVRQDILAPLGMSDTVVGAQASIATGNVAGLHACDGSRVRAFTLAEPYDNTAPAGGLYSSASDMARWLRFWMDGGRTPAGTSLISRESLREMTAMQNVIRERSPLEDYQYDAAADYGYGFGWFVGWYRGHRVLTHLGGGDGVAALISWMPDKGVGVVVLMNLEGSLGRLEIRNAIFDQALGIDGQASIEGFATLHEAWWQHLREAAEAAHKDYAPDAVSDAELSAWPGTYRGAAFGEITVLQQGQSLALRLGEGAPIALRPWGDRQLQLMLDNPSFAWPEPALLRFGPAGGAGKAEQVTLSAGGQSGDYLRVRP